MLSSANMMCSDGGGASEEIKIGAGVLDYISELGRIQAKIQEAYIYNEQQLVAWIIEQMGEE